MQKERRLSQRHFMTLPIHYREIPSAKKAGSGTSERHYTSNLSEGGLRFLSPKSYPIGTVFEITFPIKDQLMTLKARVVHSVLDRETGTYHTGVCFSNTSQLFKIKLAEQLCHIDEYRRKLSKRTGQVVSEEEAAHRWISEQSEKFSELYSI